MSFFIPGFHFDPPSTKMTPEWCQKVINYCYYNTRNICLLEGKNVKEIEEYASGDFDMKPYKKMYKSIKKQFDNAHPDMRGNVDVNTDGDNMQFLPVAAIPVKINSATAIIQKIPVEVTCVANDALAAEKKKEDITFLKNKPKIEAELQDLADQMGIGEVDLGSTKYSSVPFSSSPYGLDLNEPDELDVFVNLLYTLMVESSFETALQEFYKLKSVEQLKLLEIIDQFKFGVSVHRAFESAITGLPDIEYRFPGEIYTPFSALPDLSDRTHTFDYRSLSVMELFNNFGNEIKSKEQLQELIIGAGTGYCACNNMNNVDAKNFDTFKVNLIYCEIKSVDYIGVASNPKSKKGYSYLSGDPDQSQKRLWGQNTYCFWWLKNTKTFFNIHKLGYAHRKEGLECYQGFSHNIYRSQKKGAVELCIPENKKIQIAAIKLMHALIMSAPSGKYVDLKYLRGALSGLTNEENKWTMEDLINLYFEQNIMVGDTEGFDSKLDGQLKPFMEIPGGLKSEVTGYMSTMISGEQNISKITGINDQLTGQSANPEGLVGIQKLLINSSINALYYCNAGIEYQTQKMFTIWAPLIQNAIAAGGARKEAIVNFIGAKKVGIIEGLDQVPLHTIGINVTISQREEERARYDNKLTRLKDQGVISAADEYQLEVIENPKDKWALLAVKEKQFRRRVQEQTEAQYAQQQQMLQQQGQNMIAGKKAETEGEKEIVYAKGEVDAQIATLAAQLNLSGAQLQGVIKKKLQDDRNAAQLNKSIMTLNQKSNLQQQEPIPA